MCCVHAEGGDPSLEQILSAELGFAYFYEHLRREYSEENLVCISTVGSALTFFAWFVQMCVQAIDRFCKRPSYRTLNDIIARYIRFDAPLEINVESHIRCASFNCVQLRSRVYLPDRVTLTAHECRRDVLDAASKLRQHHDPMSYERIFNPVRVRGFLLRLICEMLLWSHALFGSSSNRARSYACG